MIFFLSNFISIATLLFCDFIFLGKDRHFLSNNLFMLCKFTTDAIQLEGGNLAASKIRNLECPSYEICLIDYGCGKFNRKIHIMEQYP